MEKLALYLMFKGNCEEEVNFFLRMFQQRNWFNRKIRRFTNGGSGIS